MRRGMFWPVLSAVAVIFLSSIIVLTPNGNFWVVPVLHSVSYISLCVNSKWQFLSCASIAISERYLTVRVVCSVSCILDFINQVNCVVWTARSVKLHTAYTAPTFCCYLHFIFFPGVCYSQTAKDVFFFSSWKSVGETVVYIVAFVVRRKGKKDCHVVLDFGYVNLLKPSGFFTYRQV